MSDKQFADLKDGEVFTSDGVLYIKNRPGQTTINSSFA